MNFGGSYEDLLQVKLGDHLESVGHCCWGLFLVHCGSMGVNWVNDGYSGGL